MLSSAQKTSASFSSPGPIPAISAKPHSRNPLRAALLSLPLSEKEVNSICRALDISSTPLSQISSALAQTLVALPVKKSATMAALLDAIHQWASIFLQKEDLIILHAGCTTTSLPAFHANMSITIVCNSNIRRTRIQHSAELFLAAFLGYFRFPLGLRVLDQSELSPRFFKSASILVHGCEIRFHSLITKNQIQ